MRLTLVIMRAILKIPYGLRRITSTGAFGKNGAVAADAPPPEGTNALKAALWAHHVKQYNASSCSVASVAAVINALRTLQGHGGPPIRQMDILETVTAANWKARMSPEGDNGRRGLPLPLLGEVVSRSMEAYHLDVRQIDIVQTVKEPSAGPIKAALKRRLADFDSRGTGLIIAHFDQGAYVPELNIPHISPIGAFDTATGEVTVLDVDPDQPYPYRVSFDTFYKGLASDYHHVFRPFGYRSGGYVYIRL
ncbi:MAG: phytochelatin synthase family protein [Pseudomonadota bacterium]